jgi:hypothetical protein
VIGVIIIFYGCKEANNPVSVTSDPSHTVFVIDSLSFQAFEVLGSIRIPLRIVYHFEHGSGSLQTISLSADSLDYFMNFTSSEPTPAGQRQIYSQEYYFLDYHLGIDSPYVCITFSGTFWERKDSTILTYGSFSRSDSSKIKVL